MANPFSAAWYRQVYRRLSTSGAVATGAAGATGVCTTPDTSHTVYVQRIVVQILTAAAQTITFQDSANTPVVVAVIPASAPVGAEFTYEFEDRGYGLTEGKNLNIAGTAGPAYNYMIEAYARLTTALAATTVNRTF